tara:strand:+ start:409 stop:939 length:531 start_codon:yes stop_codon:yes gene_type:complete
MPKKFNKKEKDDIKKSSKKAKTKDSSRNNKKLNNLQLDLDELNDKHLRLKAEFDNFRRRKRDEISRLLQYDGENIIKGFLPILDDLHRMIESSNASDETLFDGIKMVESKIQKFLESLDVKPLGEQGDLMDTELHDAMMTETDESLDDNRIISVFEKGYLYRDKVIRHAKVIVNKR